MIDSNFRVKLKIGIISTIVAFLIVLLMTGDSSIAFSFAPYYFVGGVVFVPLLIYEFTGTDWQIKLLCGSDGMAFIKLAIKIITADGKINTRQMEKLNSYVQHEYGKAILKPLFKFIKENKNLSETIQKLCIPFEEISNKEKVDIFYRLFTIAAADKILSEKEELALRAIAGGFKITNQRFKIIKKSLIKEPERKAHFQREKTQQNQSNNQYVLDHLLKKAYNPFDILKINQSATIDEVKRAYRILAKQYHPDRSMNESIDVKRQNALKILEINEAYEAIKKLRGIK